MKEEWLIVDRVEGDIAVCYSPDGSRMVDVPLPAELSGKVLDGTKLRVCFDGGSLISVDICDESDAKESERRTRLDRLFGQSKA